MSEVSGQHEQSSTMNIILSNHDIPEGRGHERALFTSKDLLRLSAAFR